MKIELAENITLIQGDCRDYLPIECSAVVTDPPYGIKRDRGMGGDGVDGFGKGIKRNPRSYPAKWDDKRPEQETIDRILSCAPISVIWGGNFMADMLPVNGKWLVWDKEQTMPSYSDAELAWTNLKGVSVKMFRYSGNGLMAKEKERVHPTQKPVALMQWCIGLTKIPTGATVLDSFMGSGTTGIACIRTGRKFIGIEKDPDYFQTAKERIEKELQQQLLPL